MNPLSLEDPDEVYGQEEGEFGEDTLLMHLSCKVQGHTYKEVSAHA